MTAPVLSAVSPFPLVLPFCVPAFLLPYGTGIFYLLSIDYAFQPRLRSRLTQGRSALPWNPWIFGRKDSHLTLATHSGILSSYYSTAPSGTASSLLRMLLYRCFNTSHGFGVMFQPRTFSAQELSTSELLRTL